MKLNNYLLLATFLLAIISNHIKAVNMNDQDPEKKIISVYDKFSYSFEESISWTIRNANTLSVIANGTGSIENLNFPVAGIYEIEYKDLATVHNECNHGDEQEKIILEVNTIQLKFDFNSLQIRNQIFGGQEQSGNELSIDAYLNTADNQNIVYNNPHFTSAGVGTTIEGKTDGSSILLYPGLNHIVFRLSGQATSGTYIMFDFIDLNNQTISYYLPLPIK